MPDVARRLDIALRVAGIPIVGVSIGNEDDPGTWAVLFAEDASDGDRRIAESIVAAFDPEVFTDIERVAYAREYVSRPEVQAFIAWGVQSLKRERGDNAPATTEEVAAGMASMQTILTERVKA